MINFGITISKQKELENRFIKLNIKECDIIEKFIHSSGNGGQNVNKVSTCVYLKYLPLNIEIKCQKARTQLLNRYYARKMLAEEIENRILGEKSKKQKEIEKIRRQKKKRSKRAKEKILEQKKMNSEKKENRKKVIIE
ncbi:MAG: peptide chain release factor-like protein [Elusimicrobia bacterium]|nr:peptide chain release factor-like protein [Elusimicrobiota bacterium]